MIFLTHLSLALLIGLLIIKNITLPFNQVSQVFLVIVLCIGSLFPDIDSATSFIGKKFKIVSLFFKHRGAIHSITVMFITSIIFFLLIKNIYYFLAFAAGFLSHLLLDSMTPKGVAFFWPNKNRIKGRIMTTGIIDIILLVFFALLDLMMLTL